ncbi:hypothetical protein DPMN_165111 [Dreissena polymorpha]|uniref:Uncharacterized protein n=1 Tax=Dreissena polymorpha TaxID=45954 RepID=A0A9D4EZZ8_DREPO|nr:hypothetical protein DPMN_165111 [Dreissena polymorpha]
MARKALSSLTILKKLTFTVSALPHFSELFKMTAWKDWSIGECIFSQNNPQRCMIPVHDNRNRRNDAVWEDQLHKCFSNSICQIIKKGLKTVAIHASVIDENLAPHFLQTFIETSIEHDLKSYICCESYEEITRVHNIVQESLLLGGQVLGRNLHYGSVQGCIIV